MLFTPGYVSAVVHGVCLFLGLDGLILALKLIVVATKAALVSVDLIIELSVTI